MNLDLPLKVTLAGFNLDSGLIQELSAAAYERGQPPPRESLTPETISAAYARISRNPAEVGELRKISRGEVEKARKSNERIVFGLGHSSVAEHATFNIDVVGLSRLAVEAVERHRLASFTEKSQRYIKLDGDIVLPPEIVDHGLADEFRDLIQRQNKTYFDLYPSLIEYFVPICREAGESNPERSAKSFASEDARYVVSLATQSQFGMTLNARTLEAMVRDALAHPLKEIQAFGSQLRDAVYGIAPSLVKYVEATEYERVQFLRASYWPDKPRGSTESVRLISHSAEGEPTVLAAMLVNRRGISWNEAVAQVREMDDKAKRVVIEDTLRHGQPWDPPPREFELAEFTFELVLSAAAYGQLKRHRMATQITGPYDPSLEWTVPESVSATGGQAKFDDVMTASAELGRKIAEAEPAAGAYALTNAHRRRVIFKANGRELYHVSRLREDQHAQWDIRQIASEMIRQTKQVAPMLLTMAVENMNSRNAVPKFTATCSRVRTRIE
jgi:flavin-dependent thymidylate synthase